MLATLYLLRISMLVDLFFNYVYNIIAIFFPAAASRGKRSPVPGIMTNKPYPTLVGDSDLSWYFGLDPDLKLEDIDPPADTQASTVEVSLY